MAIVVDSHRLADLVDAGSPERVMCEVRDTLQGILAESDFAIIDRVAADVCRLFAGTYPGYCGCNTRYHDLEHTTDTVLAVARIFHGAHVSGRPVDPRIVRLGIVSALLHDTGYIQEKDDWEGTGGKYTPVHIARSIAFTERYLPALGCSDEDVSTCRHALLCTGLDVRIREIPFLSEDEALMGRILGTADLLGQLASHEYVAKLPSLYREFVEAGLVTHVSEHAFLGNTPNFCRQAIDRFVGELGGVFLFMRGHFRARWAIDRDLYLQAIEENIAHLESVLKNHPKDYRDRLKRPGPARGGATAPGPSEGRDRDAAPRRAGSAV